MKKFCEKLIELQTSKNILKKDIAKAVGISVMAYYRYETGQRTPTLEIAIAIADFFDVSLDFLCGRTQNSEINR